jgi:hypothetical protein
MKNMKTNFKLASILLIIGFTGCCNEQLIDTYLLSEYDKSLIPFNDYQDLIYINENGQNIKASTQPRIINLERDYRGPESCEYWEVESLSNFINFPQNGFSIQLGIGTFNDLSFFGLEYVIPNSDNSDNEYFTELMNPFNEQVVDINLNGFEFKNVFVFNNNYLNENSKIDLILYSSEGKGVELISFSDGKFLKLK